MVAKLQFLSACWCCWWGWDASSLVFPFLTWLLPVSTRCLPTKAFKLETYWTVSHFGQSDYKLWMFSNMKFDWKSNCFLSESLSRRQLKHELVCNPDCYDNADSFLFFFLFFHPAVLISLVKRAAFVLLFPSHHSCPAGLISVRKWNIRVSTSSPRMQMYSPSDLQLFASRYRRYLLPPRRFVSVCLW